MEKGQAEKGKGKEAAAEESKWAAPSAAGAAADLSSSWGPSRFGSAVAAPAKKKRVYETEAQIHHRKKKNRNNWERQERKAAGLKINSPDDVPTFDESDSDDRSEDHSDDVRSDREDRDQKSRHVLRRLRAGDIPYLLGPGRFKCPWCNRKELPSDFLGMYQHATYTGVGSEKTAPHLRAKHAAYGLFFKKYVPGSRNMWRMLS